MSQPETPQDPSQHPHRDLGTEMRELGQQLEQAFKSALESDRAKQMQADVASGMKEISVQIQHAMKAIQENPQIQQLVDRGEQAVAQAQQSKAIQDVQDSLARGLALLNEQIAGVVTRLRSESGQTPPPDGGPDAGPATGETTRLDPDEKW